MFHPFQALQKLRQHYGFSDQQEIQYGFGLDWSCDELCQLEDEFQDRNPIIS